jgi:hypothetical protein
VNPIAILLWLLKNIVIGILSSAPISIAVAWYTIKPKKPLYAISGLTLTSSWVKRIEGLRFAFRRKTVPQLTVTQVCLWNGGRGTIASEDIPSTSPIKVVVPDGTEILSCHIVGASQPDIGGYVDRVDSRTYELLFCFLPRNDWLHLQVLHTAEHVEDCTVSGRLIEDGRPLRKVNVDTSIRRLRMHGVVLAVLSIVALGLISYRLLVVSPLFSDKDFQRSLGNWIEAESRMQLLIDVRKINLLTEPQLQKARADIRELKEKSNIAKGEMRRSLKHYVSIARIHAWIAGVLIGIPLVYLTFSLCRGYLVWRIPKRVLPRYPIASV